MIAKKAQKIYYHSRTLLTFAAFRASGISLSRRACPLVKRVGKVIRDSLAIGFFAACS